VIPPTILQAELELRRVVERRQGGDIPGCIAAYAEIARDHVKSLRPLDPIRLEISERVLSVLEWATLMLQTRRAYLAEELHLLRKVNSFLGAKQSAGPRFRLDL
jgi:hypothetical protein